MAMNRPTTNAVPDALGRLSASDRRALHKVAREPMSPFLGPLLRALSTELRGLELYEAQTLRDLALEELAELEEIDAKHPYPPANGPAVTFDPDAA